MVPFLLSPPFPKAFARAAPFNGLPALSSNMRFCTPGKEVRREGGSGDRREGGKKGREGGKRMRRRRKKRRRQWRRRKGRKINMQRAPSVCVSV